MAQPELRTEEVQALGRMIDEHGFLPLIQYLASRGEDGSIFERPLGPSVETLESLARRQETDAAKWTDAFMYSIRNMGTNPRDWGWMVGVFANAIEAGRSAWQDKERTEGDGMYVDRTVWPESDDDDAWQDGGHFTQLRIPEDLPQAAFITEILLPDWHRLFVMNNRKYKDVQQLGPRGVFPDINRKVGALRSIIWEGNDVPDGSEDTDRIISDLIGHLFLLWWMISDGLSVDGKGETRNDADG